jgi:hypothetical protein
MKVQFEEREIDFAFPDYSVDIEAALCPWEWMVTPEQQKRLESQFDTYGSASAK